MEDEIIKIYEFDGTYFGFRLMIKRMFSDKHAQRNKFDENKQIAYLENGIRIKKGDCYCARLSEIFEAIK